VLICQNNHWSISVPTAKQTASKTIAVKAHAYGLPGVRVDGNDVLAVYGAVRRAVDRARAGDGPTFLECVTYRMGPHSSSDDPTRYRSDAEVAEWKKRDPIDRFEKYLRRAAMLDDAGAERTRAEIGDEIMAAIKAVEDAGPPERRTIIEDVYAALPWHLEEQLEALERADPAPSH
jgi:pyruvate dehydrogenase E1 component alpha subunit/2-oxoisovalerate dehydrogenase E1 component alpha subunit